VSPTEVPGFAGVTPTDTSVAPVTANVVDPDTVPNAAVTVVDPWLTAVTSPLAPDALLTDAPLVLEDAQVAALVRFCVVLSE